eukprot:12788189-Alexandrium_andersonii.AAC.1
MSEAAQRSTPPPCPRAKCACECLANRSLALMLALHVHVPFACAHGIRSAANSLLRKPWVRSRACQCLAASCFCQAS